MTGRTDAADEPELLGSAQRKHAEFVAEGWALAWIWGTHSPVEDGAARRLDYEFPIDSVRWEYAPSAPGSWKRIAIVLTLNGGIEAQQVAGSLTGDRFHSGNQFSGTSLAAFAEWLRAMNRELELHGYRLVRTVGNVGDYEDAA